MCVCVYVCVCVRVGGCTAPECYEAQFQGDTGCHTLSLVQYEYQVCDLTKLGHRTYLDTYARAYPDIPPTHPRTDIHTQTKGRDVPVCASACIDTRLDGA